MNTPTLTIDPKFRDLLRPLTPEEFDSLQIQCLHEGIRDAITVWCKGNVILDGHNRYAIAKEHGLDFKISTLYMDTREECENWIDENQLSRRNETPDGVALIRGRIYNRSKKAHGGQKPGGKGQSDPSLSTAETLAPKLGVSEKTLKRDGAFAEAVEKLDLAADVAAGKVEASRSDVVQAAKELPAKPTPKQKAKAREKLEEPKAPRPASIKAAPLPPGPDDRDVRIAQLGRLVKERDEEIQELVQALEDANGNLKGLTIENEALRKAINADDAHAAIMAENEKCRALARVTEERSRGVQNRNKALAKTAEMWMHKFQRLEKKVKGLPADPEPTPDQVGGMDFDLDECPYPPVEV